jgi:signal transduction histidine kinase/DNA-binding response OmpR family regulator
VERQRRFRVAVQRTRAAAFLLAALSAALFSLLGVLDATMVEVVLLGGTGMLTAGLFSCLVTTGVASRMGRTYDGLWMLTDVVLISWVVHTTGGASSPWFPWYLSNIAAGAFVLGPWCAFVVFVADTVAYLGVIAGMGQITGLDRTLYEPLMRMVFLYGASVLSLRGIGLLKVRRDVIRQMRDAEARRVDELTRLTAVLDQRTREIADASVRIHEADRLKSQFLANMSHELRTPLNSIIGFSDVLMSRLPADLPAKQRRFVENINSSGQHLLNIINDLLDLSKIEAGRMELHPEAVDPLPLIDSVCTIVRGTCSDRSIDFEIDHDGSATSVTVDPVRLKQILFNLVSNAAKFSDDGSVVSVRVLPVDAPDSPLDCDSVQIAVIDRGAGIDPRHHRAIFEEFRQIDGTSTRAHGGTGLGLALVKRLVELHSGQIKVDSERGRGSTFTITLPRDFAGHAAADEPAPQILDLPSEHGRRILVVEDDPTAYDTIRRHIEAAGYVPVRARTGEEAVRLARLLSPAAITLDIILPGIDGWEILRRLKAEESTREMPVIIVSVLDNRDLALALGAADYFVKPVDGDHLIARLTELLPREDHHPPRLLLIDDEPELHELVEARLTPLGYEVLHALSGREGLDRARRTPPELILLDLMMEEMDGFEVATELSADPDTTGIPVVVLTAKDVTGADRARLQGKIAALVGKADMPGTALVTTIRSLLERRRREVLHA